MCFAPVAMAVLFLVGTACADVSAPVADAAQLSFVAGSPTGTVAHALAVAPAIRVHDAEGRPIRGKHVTFTVVAGDGFITDTIATTDADGVASTRWSLGPDAAAAQRLRAAADGREAHFEARAARPVAGRTYYGNRQYIEYIAGDLPIVITAPHGGLLMPSAIPDRTWGITGRDTNTQELTRAIADALAARTGGRPHVIINRLGRVKLDANREVVEAAQDNALAGLAWLEFHAYTDAAKRDVAARVGRGFYIDVHGHGHAIPRLELGYTLSAAELAMSDVQIEQTALIDRSTIRTLVRSGSRGFAEVLRGTSSLGALFEAAGYPAVPSPAAPDPGGAEYFTGGYNVARHGSRNGGPIDGVQIEIHFPGARDTESNRARFAVAVAAVLEAYMATHYNFDLRTLRTQTHAADAWPAATLPGPVRMGIVQPF